MVGGAKNSRIFRNNMLVKKTLRSIQVVLPVARDYSFILHQKRHEQHIEELLVKTSSLAAAFKHTTLVLKFQIFYVFRSVFLAALPTLETLFRRFKDLLLLGLQCQRVS